MIPPKGSITAQEDESTIAGRLEKSDKGAEIIQVFSELQTPSPWLLLAGSDLEANDLSSFPCTLLQLYNHEIMNIRIARAKDLGSMVSIYNQSIAAGQKTADITPVTIAGRQKWFTNHAPDKHPILVAEKKELIVGYLTISAYRPGRAALRHTAEVSFYIHFEHQRQGIAAQLLQHAIDRCPSLQIKTLFAILIDSNLGSIKFLEKFGFEQWGHMPRIAEFAGVEAGHLYYGLRVDTN